MIVPIHTHSLYTFIACSYFGMCGCVYCLQRQDINPVGIQQIVISLQILVVNKVINATDGAANWQLRCAIGFWSLRLHLIQIMTGPGARGRHPFYGHSAVLGAVRGL